MQGYIQICQSSDNGQTVTDCRYIPATGLSGTTTLGEAMPVIIAVVSLWITAWGIRQLIRFMR